MLQILINLLFLIPLSVRDIKVLNVPRIYTLLFVIWSLLNTTALYIIESVVIVIIMWALTHSFVIGTGDRKFLFGLTLQYGFVLGLSMIIGMMAVMLIKAIMHDRSTFPLLPVLLVVYVIYLVSIYRSAHI